MDNSEKTGKRDIMLMVILKKISANKKKYITVAISACVVTYLLTLTVPRYYRCDVTLAPETTNDMSKGGLMSIASSFGLNMNGGSSDAISPEIYPNLLESNDFILDLLKIQVTTLDKEVNTDYYTYLKHHKKENMLLMPLKYIGNMFKKEDKHTVDSLNTFQMSRDDNMLFTSVRKSIEFCIDKKTGLISVTVQDQDPLVSALMADSVSAKLQEFIIRYRTKKARIDVDYYQKLADSTKIEYDKAANEYNIYCDTHKDIILQTAISRRDRLEEKMQMKFEAYRTICSQLEAMKAKLQERTPAFTVIKQASVPVKPAGPKRLIISVAMAVLACVVFTSWIIRKEIMELFI